MGRLCCRWGRISSTGGIRSAGSWRRAGGGGGGLAVDVAGRDGVPMAADLARERREDVPGTPVVVPRSGENGSPVSAVASKTGENGSSVPVVASECADSEGRSDRPAPSAPWRRSASSGTRRPRVGAIPGSPEDVVRAAGPFRGRRKTSSARVRRPRGGDVGRYPSRSTLSPSRHRQEGAGTGRFRRGGRYGWSSLPSSPWWG